MLNWSPVIPAKPVISVPLSVVVAGLLFVADVRLKLNVPLRPNISLKPSIFSFNGLPLATVKDAVKSIVLLIFKSIKFSVPLPALLSVTSCVANTQLSLLPSCRVDLFSFRSPDIVKLTRSRPTILTFS